MAGRPWSAEEIAVLRERYPAEGAARLAIDLGRTQSAVRQQACLLGVAFPGHISFRERKAKVDTEFFSRPLDCHSAYILGYIVSDGSIYRRTRNGAPSGLSFACIATDVAILEYIKTRTNSGHPITFVLPKKGLGKTRNLVATLRISSSIMARALIEKFGVVPNKTKFGTHLPDLPPEMLPHFFRGAFDGDGSVYLNHRTQGNGRWISLGIGVSLVGCENYLRQVAVAVSSNAGLCYTPTPCPRRSIHGIAWGSRRDVRALYRWMYPDEPVDYFWLERKRAVFEEYFADHPESEDRFRGEASTRAKLTEAAVREIRNTPYYHGMYTELGIRYGVARNTISGIHNGRAWIHVGDSPLGPGTSAEEASRHE